MNPDASKFQGILAGEMTDFLRHQRALGKRFLNEEGGLRLFDQYLVERKIESVAQITPELVDAFLASRPRTRPRSYNHLLSVVRRLFKWLVRQGRLSQSPVQSRPRRATAAQMMFLFDRSQAQQLLSLARELPDNNNGPNRGRIYFMVFALMYGLGLRVGEAVRLCRQDVDLERKVLVIRQTKFLKSRLVPKAKPSSSNPSTVSQIFPTCLPHPSHLTHPSRKSVTPRPRPERVEGQAYRGGVNRPGPVWTK
jgi:site-specific recombinase XerD